jgi:nicotinate-nucleotide adenylyltransferase
MKVIFGGAFNPVTNAHLEVYNYVNQKVKSDEFIFLPVSSAYTKSELASNFHRLNMLKLAIDGKKNVRVSELEMNDSDFLGTYQSLIRFSDGENCELGFVIGADNLVGMEHWINIEGIVSEFTIIVLGRNGLDIKELIDSKDVLRKYKHNFIICDEFDVPISSTMFRKTLDQTKVPEKVYDYIMENDLYQGDDDDRV